MAETETIIVEEKAAEVVIQSPFSTDNWKTAPTEKEVVADVVKEAAVEEKPIVEDKPVVEAEKVVVEEKPTETYSQQMIRESFEAMNAEKIVELSDRIEKKEKGKQCGGQSVI